MTIYGVVFYVLAVVIVGTTVLAATRRDPVHAVVWLVAAFLGTAMLFYLLGAPLPAALEVVIYAGAIMVLFLFIVMLVRGIGAGKGSRLRWLVPLEVGAFAVWAAFRLAVAGPDRGGLAPAMASPTAFGRFVFSAWWLPVELVSLLLFVALVGALYLGRGRAER